MRGLQLVRQQQPEWGGGRMCTEEGRVLELVSFQR